MSERQKSKTRQSASRFVFAAFKVLKDNGGKMRGKDVMDKITETIKLNEWEKEVYEKS